MNKPCLDFIPTLRLVVQPQFLKGCSGLGLDAREGFAHLVIRKQGSAMTVLHDMGRLMSKDHPDLPGVILDVVGADQQGVAGRMKGAQQG